MIKGNSKIKKAGVLFILVLMQTLIGCTKDDEQPKGASKKIVLKAEASAGVVINMVVYGYDTQLTTISKANVQTWTSPEIIVPAGATVATITANAMGVNASSTLKVQVYVDGVVKKEGTSTGPVLSATAQYNLK